LAHIRLRRTSSSLVPATREKLLTKVRSFFCILMSDMYTVYVLYSKSFNKIYIGFTSNIEARFKSHNQLSTKGWTIKFRPCEIVHEEKYGSKREALDREKQLKSAKGREWIRNEIIIKY